MHICEVYTIHKSKPSSSVRRCFTFVDSLHQTKVQAGRYEERCTESSQLVVAIGAPNKQLWNEALKWVVGGKSTLRCSATHKYIHIYVRLIVNSKWKQTTSGLAASVLEEAYYQQLRRTFWIPFCATTSQVKAFAGEGGVSRVRAFVFRIINYRRVACNIK